MVSWLLAQTRPVLAPLAWSTLCRIGDHLLGCFLLGLSAWGVFSYAIAWHNGAGFSTSVLTTIVVTMVLVCLLKALLHYGEQFLGHLVAFKALELLRTNLFSSLIPRSPALVCARSSSGSGDLLSRITSDIDGIEVFFAHSIAPIISSVVVPFFLLGGIGILISPSLAFTAALVVVITWCLLLIVGWKSTTTAAESRLRSTGQINQHLSDTIHGLAEVIGYNAVQRRTNELTTLRHTSIASSQRIGFWLSTRRIFTTAGQVLSVILPLWAVWSDLTTGQLSVQWCAVALILLWRQWETIDGVEACATALHTALSGARRIYEVAHSPLPILDGTTPFPTDHAPDITWNNVYFSYPEEGEQLRGAHLKSFTAQAHSGQWTTFIGRTGSGKSTVIRLLLRYWEPTQGTILINDTDLSQFSRRDLYASVGVVAQHSSLMSGTIADNLSLATPHITDSQMWEALHAVGLAEEITSQGGLAASVGEAGSSLSGGQQQRLAIAAMLLKRPSLVILDEATSHLNPPLAAQVRHHIRDFLPNATVIEISHSADREDPLIDQVINLDGGKIIETSQRD
ncbi:ATP-binding cassette domain-containing protein [Corynebacterium poyangense]|uniref:ATP-binding cassette domain-containing protein n=1 Tax=Corynebacterium poyangense TaxID=2684405 RepID=A0A7H0SPK0_9CORY|nr:ABC transporter ATP-binding protein [Corynebacterium poyangense]QNQ90475.1 ATP-binding cassette domain-containing protein [Corynebacterium poyangense]